ncbi:hypothetical protein P4H42_09525 [Paenibacillus macerans]|nr:hypothetical protein [Paenibacillus macerans]MEC0329857.1 hypothetical protein [Paenibacillus macerans]
MGVRRVGRKAKGSAHRNDPRDHQEREKSGEEKVNILPGKKVKPWQLQIP